MRVTMVKKITADGTPCSKCRQAEARLRENGLLDQIDAVVIADERDPESPGWAMAREHGAANAPFWIVEYLDDKSSAEVITSVLKLTQVLAGVEDTQAQRIVDLAPSSRRQVREMAEAMKGTGPADLVKWALMTYGVDCTIAFSGAEDVALVDMAVKSGYAFTVFTLDTGRLHPETYDYLERVRLTYQLDLEILSPDQQRLETFVREKGLFSFLRDGHSECCAIRKVAPLRRHLKLRRAWITGQRRDQSPTRGNIPVLQVDDAFDGAGASGLLVKVNPLANWSSERVWDHIRTHDVPHNTLHERGFRSIGCAPCTRATHPGEHEREGRWWWEDATRKECGLHLT